MAKQKVFLVDDDSDILVLNRDFLESEGYDVVTATSCAEALEKIKLHSFSCIVLDVMLPDGSAFDLAPKIKEYTDCPIIFLTVRISRKTLSTDLRLVLMTTSQSLIPFLS